MTDMKMLHYFKYILLSVYLIYAVSPLVGNVDNSPLGGITKDRSTATLHLLLVDLLLSCMVDECEPVEQGEVDSTDDFLVKKFRCLPSGRSMGKKIIAESHIRLQHIVPVIDCSDCQQQVPAYAAVPDPLSHIFAGYSTLHSGQSPPLFSLS